MRAASSADTDHASSDASMEETGVLPAQRRPADSPEGLPANPGLQPRQISLLLSLTVILVMLAALVLAIFVNSFVGGLAGALALVILLFNPAFWASAFRAKERASIEQRNMARAHRD